jgi:hypothetical protein
MKLHLGQPVFYQEIIYSFYGGTSNSPTYTEHMENLQHSKVKVPLLAVTSWKTKQQRYDDQEKFLCGIL